MAIIQKLSIEETKKIAAGEVVERPVNIVKELVENAIDAQATVINIYIENGGKKLIRVQDNGIGMDSADAQKCFEHHATSKISSVDDLQRINSFGFRGEALSSIASVSKVELITKQKNVLEGTCVVIENGKLLKNSASSAAEGTDITITQLFETVPVRKKFLKAKETEWRQIQQFFFAAVLGYTHISFKLYSQGNLLFNCRAESDIKKRWQMLQGSKDVVNQLISVKGDADNVTMSGVISNQQHGRYDRNGMYFFINNRWVKNYILSRAIIAGYQNSLPTHQFPIACLKIQLDSALVDVNTHPRKEEVQFLHPQKIQNLIKDLVKKSLEYYIEQRSMQSVDGVSKPIMQRNHESYEKMPEAVGAFNFAAPFVKNLNEIQDKNPMMHSSFPTNGFSNTAATTNKDEYFLDHAPDSQMETAQTFMTESFPVPQEKSKNELVYEKNTIVEKQESALEQESNTPTLLGVYAKTYIIVDQHPLGLMFLDQHAVHERILYEEFSLERDDVSVQLLFPIIIDYSKEVILSLIKNQNVFTEAGIIMEQFAEEKMKITAVPVALKNSSIKDILDHCVSVLHTNKIMPEKEMTLLLKKRLYADMACKAAVKAGDDLKEDKIQELLSRFFVTENRMSCPHGRPTTWQLPIDVIKKKFKRDYR